MKIGIIGDVHFNQYSSILRERGEKYSLRLENCIDSINWAERSTAHCDLVVYLGDFFDKSSLNAEELTALTDIVFNDVPHRFLVGNHEMGINSLIYSSAHVFDSLDMTSVIDKPVQTDLAHENTTICFLPYMLEEDRKPLSEIFPHKKQEYVVIFSHNDIAGIQMGPVISKTGFSIEEIETNCDHFFNGHLHNGMPITNKIINVGNLTGQNFSEDGFRYSHNIFILDTDKMKYEVLRNPYAINFYKLEDIRDLDRVTNAVVTLKVKADEASMAKELLEQRTIASRLVIDYGSTKTTAEGEELELSVNHLSEFSKFVRQELEGKVNAELMEEELGYIYG